MIEDSDSWEPELLESQLHGIDPENEPIMEGAVRVPAKRGPKKLPLMWSRVISVSEDADADLRAFPIEEDMKVMGALPRPPPPRRAIQW